MAELTFGEHPPSKQDKMPRTGAYSKGCQSCKQRRVKCDLKKPTCQRCAVGGRDCVYKDEFEVRLRDETAHAKKVATKKWRQRSKPNQQQALVPPEGYDQSVISYLQKRDDRHEDVYAIPSITAQLQETAICRFFFDHVLAQNRVFVSGLFPGFLEFLPAEYAKAPKDSALHTATCAVAFANLSGRDSSNVPRSYASATYGKALKLVNAALRDTETAVRDDTLLSIYLLGMYEVINAEKVVSGGYGGWKKHAEGALMLLKLRGEDRLQTELGSRLTRLILSQTITSCLSWRHRPSIPIEEWSKIIDMDGTGFQLIRRMYAVAEALGDAMEVHALHFNEQNNPEIAAALARLRTLDNELESFMDGIRGGRVFNAILWPPESIPEWAEPFINFPGHPRVYHTYPVLNFAGWWNMYRTTRLIINQTILEILHFDSIEPMETHQDSSKTGSETFKSRAIITWAIEDICASAPAHLSISVDDKPVPKTLDEVCGLRGFLLLWPIFMVERALTALPEAWIATEGTYGWVMNLKKHLEKCLSVSTPPSEYLSRPVGQVIRGVSRAPSPEELESEFIT